MVSSVREGEEAKASPRRSLEAGRMSGSLTGGKAGVGGTTWARDQVPQPAEEGGAGALGRAGHRAPSTNSVVLTGPRGPDVCHQSCDVE